MKDPFVYAKIDVCIPTHPKFIKAGPAAVGYWAACVAHSRGTDATGEIDNSVLGIILGVGSRDALRYCTKLVEVGLFEKTESGYRILNYGKKNDTPDVIEAR